MPLPQLGDRVVDFLPRQHALALQHFDERGNFPHGADGEVFDGDKFVSTSSQAILMSFNQMGCYNLSNSLILEQP